MVLTSVAFRRCVQPRLLPVLYRLMRATPLACADFRCVHLCMVSFGGNRELLI